MAVVSTGPFGWLSNRLPAGLKSGFNDLRRAAGSECAGAAKRASDRLTGLGTVEREAFGGHRMTAAVNPDDLPVNGSRSRAADRSGLSSPLELQPVDLV